MWGKSFSVPSGVGYAQLVTSVVVSIYYNVILAYTVFYMAQSFRSKLPWTSCESWWGADSNCYVRREGVVCDLLISPGGIILSSRSLHSSPISRFRRDAMPKKIVWWISSRIKLRSLPVSRSRRQRTRRPSSTLASTIRL